MRKIIFTLALMFMLSSCSVTRYYISSDYKLAEVENGSEVKLVSGSTYSDGIIDIGLNYTENAIQIEIVNTSNSSIKVVWDDGAYIDPDGGAHRIIHTGTKLVDKEKAQVPSILPKGSNIKDEIVPADCIELKNDMWQYSPIAKVYSEDYKSYMQAEAAITELYPIKLMLPIEYEGAKREYMFTFKGMGSKIERIEVNDYTAVYVGIGMALLVSGAAIISLGSTD